MFQTKYVQFRFSRYVEPENSVIESSSILSKSVEWCDRHVIQSQYLLQILKCSNEKCCKKRRSSIFKFLPEKGLPAPIPLTQMNDGLKIPDVKEVESFASLFVSLALEAGKIEMTSKYPLHYDSFCPSVQSKLKDRTCVCGRYYSSIAAMKDHLKNNVKCKKLTKALKPKKILTQRNNEKLVLVDYDGEEDVEWVYDIDIETDEIFIEEDADDKQNQVLPIEKILEPIWEEC